MENTKPESRLFDDDITNAINIEDIDNLKKLTDTRWI